MVFDHEKTHTVSARPHHSIVDYNLFEGTEVVGSPGEGRFVRRARFGEQLTGAEVSAEGS